MKRARHFSRHVKKARNPLSRRIKKRVILSRDIKIWMILRLTLYSFKLSGQLSNNPDSFQTDRTVFKPSGEFSNRPDSFQIVQTVFKPSGQFSNCPNSFQIVRTVFKLSRQFSNRPDSFSNRPDSF